MVLLLALMAASASQADELRAREAFEAAQIHIEEHDYAAARPELEMSLELFATPAAAFNLAIVQRALGDYLAARTLLEKLRDGEFGRIPEVRIDTVDRWLAESAAKLARLTIRTGTTVTWLEVGKDRLETEREEMVLELNPGRYELRAGNSAGTMTQSVELAPGELRALEFYLDATNGSASPTKLETNAANESPLLESLWFWSAVSAVAVGSTVAIILLNRGSDSEAPPTGGTITTPP